MASLNLSSKALISSQGGRSNLLKHVWLRGNLLESPYFSIVDIFALGSSVGAENVFTIPTIATTARTSRVVATSDIMCRLRTTHMRMK